MMIPMERYVVLYPLPQLINWDVLSLQVDFVVGILIKTAGNKAHMMSHVQYFYARK